MDRTSAVYRRLLEAVGGRASELGARRIVSHWPFVGSNYRGLVIVGQALQGWDAPDSTARWHASDASTAEGRERVLAGTIGWAAHRDEPIYEVARFGHRMGAPFWQISKAVATALEPAAPGSWLSRYAWWNVYPLGWEEPDEGPTGALLAMQKPHARELFWSVLDDLEAERVVLVSGKSWWWEVRSLLGLDALEQAARPILAAGRIDGRAIVASYHPRGARQVGIRDHELVAAIGKAMANVEGVPSDRLSADDCLHR